MISDKYRQWILLSYYYWWYLNVKDLYGQPLNKLSVKFKNAPKNILIYPEKFPYKKISIKLFAEISECESNCNGLDSMNKKLTINWYLYIFPVGNRLLHGFEYRILIDFVNKLLV